MSAAACIRALRRAGLTLAESYPYAADAGTVLRQRKPEWWARFTAADPDAAALALEQAVGYRFLAYCEADPQWRAELDRALCVWLAEAEAAFTVELMNTANWYARAA